jgi:hypothetical protein
MQIRKSDDFRVNEIAVLIEELQDYKYNVKPFEIANAIVKYIDQIYGQAYAKKLSEYMSHERDFIGKNKV